MHKLTNADTSWLLDYSSAIHDHYREVFASSSSAFSQAGPLLKRFLVAKQAVATEGWRRWAALDEAHNELCVAGAILGSPDHRIDELSYEPTPVVGAKTVDFCARGHDGRCWLIDVKTIAPERIDRWEQFETAKTEGWLAEGTNLVLLHDWLGGELWHSKTTARSRMLEYTLELEGKLEAYPGFDADTTILMLCGSGFHWHEDELEDFVAYYADGQHRADDPLASMESHFVEE